MKEFLLRVGLVEENTEHRVYFKMVILPYARSTRVFSTVIIWYGRVPRCRTHKCAPLHLALVMGHLVFFFFNVYLFVFGREGHAERDREPQEGSVLPVDTGLEPLNYEIMT